MTPIETIRTACIAANPEIMELKFGCEIKVRQDFRNQMGLLSGYVAGVDFAVLDTVGGIGEHADVDLMLIRSRPDAFEILGRSIRLADVLLALGLGEFDSQKALQIEQESVHEIVILYDLLHDDLSLQSPETIKFLAEILK